MNITKEDLILLSNQYDSKKDISDILGISEWKTRKLFKVYDVTGDGRINSNKKRKKEIPSKEQLINLYNKDNLTLLDISRLYNVSNVTVKKWFVLYSIPLLSHSKTIEKKVLPKIIVKNKIKYGKEHFFSTEEGKKKVSDTFIKKYGVPYHPIKNESKAELDILQYFNSLQKGFSKNTSYGIELDGYNDDLKIAFEYCGLYWHSETKKGKSLHHKKYKICNEKGIRLITIFEDEWIHKNEQTKGFIKSILRKTENKIYARKLILEKVDKRHKQTIDFINENHIQGSPNINTTLFHYILRDNNDIFASISYSKHHRNNKEIVLSRLCIRIGYDVVGGSERLFKHSKKDINGIIKSWSDNRWSNGNLYRKLGFILHDELNPDYSYFIKNSRISKQKMTKGKMKALDNETEYECAKRLGFDRIWDCGKKTWIYK